MGAILGLAAAVGLLVATRSVVALDVPDVILLLGIETIPTETFGIHWSEAANWPVQRQQIALASLLATLGALGVGSVLVSMLNVVILLAEAAASRRRDLAVRVALGATPFLLVRRLAGELRTLVASGFALGLFAGLAGGALARGMWPDVTEPIASAPFSDLLFVAMVLLGATVLAHVGGAWRIARAGGTIALLRSGSRATEEPAAILARNVLTVTQMSVAGAVVIAMMALVAPVTSELARSASPDDDSAVTASQDDDIAGAVSQDDDVAGITSQLVVIEAGLPMNGSWAAALDSLRTVPGLAAESLAAPGALLGLGVRDITITECGRCVRGLMPAPLWKALADHHVVAPGFFDLTGLEVVAGRVFQDGDDETTGPVAIVNEAFTYTGFDTDGPIGKRIQVGLDFQNWYTVIGVVANRVEPTLGGEGAVREAVYLSALQRSPSKARFLLRGDESSIASASAMLGREGFAEGEAVTLDAYLSEHSRVKVWSGRVAALLSLLVVLLAAHGIYVTALQTTRRGTAALAVRRAVGAPSRRIVGYVLAKRLRVTVWGLGGVAFFGTLALAFVQGALGSDGPPLSVWAAVAMTLTTLSVVASIQAVREAITVEPSRLLE